MYRFMRSAIFVGSLLALQVWGEGPRAPVQGAEFIQQKEIGGMACGPCSIFHSFTHGRPEMVKMIADLPGQDATQKVFKLIDLYGAKPSDFYHKKVSLYDKKKGSQPSDLSIICNDMLAAAGSHLQVEFRLMDKKSETAKNHLLRVHRQLSDSLRSGFPPILDAKSFAAQSRASGEGYEWNRLMGHFVTLLEIQCTAPR
ncbi:MAG: hypothetical protein RL095_3172 [Verrucomicrobiota bacterium]